MNSDQVDAIVIGAGVIGLACARNLAAKGLETFIIESHEAIGQEISSRNSEVIHAGLYYTVGSLKAKLCLSGRHALYEYCETRHIPHKKCGKLIVANSIEQEKKLLQLHNQALANGVADVELIGPNQARELEPALTCTAALLSPSTGIIDSHSLMLSFMGDAQANGASLVLCSQFLEAEVVSNGLNIKIKSGDEILELKSSILINAAGLSAPDVARNISGLKSETIPTSHFAKGNYFSLEGIAPFSRLIYPVPEPGGLGVHLTLDMGGQAKFGPDVEWVDVIDYEVNIARAKNFYASIRSYWQKLPNDSLHAAYSGIRPKVVSKGEPDADFMIHGESEHGCPGLVNLFGIESPGLTSSLAIADHVAGLLGLQ